MLSRITVNIGTTTHLRMPFPIVTKSVSNSRLDIFFDRSLIVATLKSLLLVILIVYCYNSEKKVFVKKEKFQPSSTTKSAQTTWTKDTSVEPGKRWYRIAMSSDGTKQTAVVYEGNIWRSVDSGATWTEDTSVGSTKY